MNNWTGERLETFVYNENTLEHLHRYSIAKEYTAGKHVLDIASGEGYGSFLLSANALHVTGVDIDAETVQLAQKKYGGRNIDFKTGSADKIPAADRSMDVVVSFETIEHHDKHEEMLLEIKRVLKPGGMLIMSSPDKKHYTDERNYRNPFHIKELYFDEFKQLIQRHFAHSRFYFQNVFSGSVVIPESDSHNFQLFDGDYSNVSNQGYFKSMYAIVLASDSPVEHKLDASGFAGTTIVQKEEAMKAERVYQDAVNWITGTPSFRVGSALLRPLKWLKK
jgi:ubiquinone/menaquinone biosynthesis C-methylase UbiE